MAALIQEARLLILFTNFISVDANVDILLHEKELANQNPNTKSV